MKSGAIQNSGCGFEAMKTWAWRIRGTVPSIRIARTATASIWHPMLLRDECTAGLIVASS